MLVTPYLVEPMSHDQVPPTPGDEVKEPNDLEFYFLNRIEARTGKDFRATTTWDDPYNLRNHLKLGKEVRSRPGRVLGMSDGTDRAVQGGLKSKPAGRIKETTAMPDARSLEDSYPRVC